MVALSRSIKLKNLFENGDRFSFTLSVNIITCGSCKFFFAFRKSIWLPNYICGTQKIKFHIIIHQISHKPTRKRAKKTNPTKYYLIIPVADFFSGESTVRQPPCNYLFRLLKTEMGSPNRNIIKTWAWSHLPPGIMVQRKQ